METQTEYLQKVKILFYTESLTDKNTSSYFLQWASAKSLPSLIITPCNKHTHRSTQSPYSTNLSYTDPHIHHAYTHILIRKIQKKISNIYSIIFFHSIQWLQNIASFCAILQLKDIRSNQLQSYPNIKWMKIFPFFAPIRRISLRWINPIIATLCPLNITRYTQSNSPQIRISQACVHCNKWHKKTKPFYNVLFTVDCTICSTSYTILTLLQPNTRHCAEHHKFRLHVIPFDSAIETFANEVDERGFVWFCVVLITIHHTLLWLWLSVDWLNFWLKGLRGWCLWGWLLKSCGVLEYCGEPKINCAVILHSLIPFQLLDTYVNMIQSFFFVGFIIVVELSCDTASTSNKYAKCYCNTATQQQPK